MPLSLFVGRDHVTRSRRTSHAQVNLPQPFNVHDSLAIHAQPPLQFYISVIQSRAWSDVSIVTRAAADEDINPTFRVLQMLSGAGAMGPNVAVHKVSTCSTLRSHKMQDMLYVMILAGRSNTEKA